MARGGAVKIKPGAKGGHVSARSKTGRSECSQAVSDWKTHGMTPAIAAILGKCRSITKAQKSAAAQRAAGNEAKAQHLEHRAASGVVGKEARLARARELMAGRRAAQANEKTAKALSIPNAHTAPAHATMVSGKGEAIPARSAPSLREQASAHRAGKGDHATRAAAATANAARGYRLSKENAQRAIKAGNAPLASKHTERATVRQRRLEHVLPMREGAGGAKWAQATVAGTTPHPAVAKAQAIVAKHASLREQAAQHRAGKGDKATRVKALVDRSNKKYAKAHKTEEKYGKELDAATRARTAAEARGEDVSAHRARERAIMAKAQAHTKTKTRLRGHADTINRIRRAAAH